MGLFTWCLKRSCSIITFLFGSWLRAKCPASPWSKTSTWVNKRSEWPEVRLKIWAFLFNVLVQRTRPLPLNQLTAYKLPPVSVILFSYIPISLEHMVSVNSPPGLTSHCRPVPCRDVFADVSGCAFLIHRQKGWWEGVRENKLTRRKKKNGWRDTSKRYNWCIGHVILC